MKETLIHIPLEMYNGIPLHIPSVLCLLINGRSASLALERQVSHPLHAPPPSSTVVLRPQVGVASDIAVVAGGVRGHGVEEVGEVSGGVGARSRQLLVQQELQDTQRTNLTPHHRTQRLREWRRVGQNNGLA